MFLPLCSMGCIRLDILESFSVRLKVVYGSVGVEPKSAQSFTSVDPLAHKYPNVGSYVYCMGNPVKYVDPDGREVFKLGFSYSMSSGVFGGGLKILGIGLKGTWSQGAVKQELGFYISYDTDKNKIGVGCTKTDTNTKTETSVTVGPYKGSEGKEMTTVRDLNTTDGYSKTEDKVMTNKESGGLGVVETTTKNGTSTTEINASLDVNVGIVGVGAKAGLSIEPSQSTNSNSKSSTSKSVTPTSGSKAGSNQQKTNEPWILFKK